VIFIVHYTTNGQAMVLTVDTKALVED